MAEEFGTLLRKLRLAKGLSIGQLAKNVHFSKGYLSKIENGHKPANLALARQCESVLGAGGALLALVTPARAPAPLDDGVEGDDVWTMSLDQTGDIQFLPLHRRQFLAASAGAVLGVALTRGCRPPAPDERVVLALRASFDDMRRMGMVASPLTVLPSVVAQVHTLRVLAADSSGPIRAELRILASRVAEYTGWMFQEAGQEQLALWWTDYAVALARAGNDAALASYALVRHAEIAMYRLDPTTTIELARRAQLDDAVGPRVLGQAARCEAQGHALAGDVRAHLKALDRAATLLDGADQDERSGPVLGSSVADQVSLATGWSLCDLGRPGDAAEVLDREVPKLSDESRRARARFGARRVLAHATNGEVELACELLRPVLDDSLHVDSATVRVDLREVGRTLSRWHGHSAVQEIRPQLVAALRQPK